jgi:hypothetical protein
MSSEKLVAARLSLIGEDIPESDSREEGKVRYETKSGGEDDLTDVDVDPKDLVDARNANHILQLSSLVNRRLLQI